MADRLPSPLARLPLSLVQSVFGFAVDSSSSTSLATIAHVSRDWLVLASTIASAAKLRAFVMDLDTNKSVAATASSHLGLRHDLTLRRAHLRELAVMASDDLLVPIDLWVVLFAQLPHLEILCVLGTPGKNCVRSVAALLNVASRLCPNIHSIKLPSEWYPTRSSTDDEDLLLPSLEMSLKRWKRLRHLEAPIPFVRTTDAATQATRFVDAFVENCPHLETLGREPADESNLQTETDHQWHISLETWARFCGSASHFTAFYWTAIPLTSALVEGFGRFQKPQLTRLVLMPPTNWRWSLSTQYDRDSFGTSGFSPEVMLRTCPALRDLRIVLRPESGADPAVFGDTLCEAVAICCLHLERFTLCMLGSTKWLSDYEPPRWTTTESFTDNALMSLAKLPRLSEIEAKIVNITGNGLFALASAFPKREWKMQRNYTITVGDEEYDSLFAERFYNAAFQFLSHLAEYRGEERTVLPCAFERVVLRLLNGNAGYYDEEFGSEKPNAYFDRLKTLIDTVQRKHPQIHVRVVLRGSNQFTAFDVIDEVDVYTSNAVLPAWESHGDTRVDDVFVSRDDSDDDRDGYDYDDDYQGRDYGLSDY